MFYRLNIADLQLVDNARNILLINEDQVEGLCSLLMKNPDFKMPESLDPGMAVDDKLTLYIKGFTLPVNHDFLFLVNKQDRSDISICIIRQNEQGCDFCLLDIQNIYLQIKDPVYKWLLSIIITVKKATGISGLNSLVDGYWHYMLSFQAEYILGESEFSRSDKEKVIQTMKFYESKAFYSIITKIDAMAFNLLKPIPLPPSNIPDLIEIYSHSLNIIQSGNHISDFQDIDLLIHESDFSVLELCHSIGLSWNMTELHTQTMEFIYQCAMEEGMIEQAQTISSYNHKSRFRLPKQNNLSKEIDTWISLITKFTQKEI